MSESILQPLSWRAHPARERRAHTIGALVMIVLFSGLIFGSFRSVAWSAVSLVILILALNRFFFPSRFSIDEEGITARYPLRRLHLRWTDLRRFVHDRNGGYLSTRSQPSRFDAYHGMHILFGDQRDTVIDRIREHLAEARGA